MRSECLLCCWLKCWGSPDGGQPPGMPHLRQPLNRPARDSPQELQGAISKRTVLWFPETAGFLFCMNRGSALPPSCLSFLVGFCTEVLHSFPGPSSPECPWDHGLCTCRAWGPRRGAFWPTVGQGWHWTHPRLTCLVLCFGLSGRRTCVRPTSPSGTGTRRRHRASWRNSSTRKSSTTSTKAR